MEFNDIEQRRIKPTVGAENRFNGFERFDVNIKAAVASLAGKKVNPGVRVIDARPSIGNPLTGALLIW